MRRSTTVVPLVDAARGHHARRFVHQQVDDRRHFGRPSTLMDGSGSCLRAERGDDLAVQLDAPQVINVRHPRRHAVSTAAIELNSRAPSPRINESLRRLWAPERQPVCGAGSLGICGSQAEQFRHVFDLRQIWSVVELGDRGTRAWCRRKRTADNGLAAHDFPRCRSTSVPSTPADAAI